MARTVGTYFVMPKWAKGLRPGRTYLDIYKLFDGEELAALPAGEVRRRVGRALFFDAYRDQEQYRVRYRRGDRVEGLENVLYMCPICGKEFTIRASGPHTLSCSACGFSETADRYGFFHRTDASGDIRYVSDWSARILELRRARMGRDLPMDFPVSIQTVDPLRNKFRPSGEGRVLLTADRLILQGSCEGAPLPVEHPADSFPILPFSPGRYFEIQSGKEIYRCIPEDGRLVMKFIDSLKLLHEGSAVAVRSKAASEDHPA